MSDHEKSAIRLLNQLLSNNSFLHELADYSKKDYSLLLSNMSKIIMYYLHTKDTHPCSIEELMNKINNSTLEQIDYIMIPSNQVYKNHILIHGLNGRRNPLNDMLIKLSSSVSFRDYPTDLSYATLHTNPSEALTSTLEYPSILFNGILKRPYNRDIINPQESERVYYQSILNTRLKNVSELDFGKAVRTSKRVMSKFIPNKPMMIIIPKREIKELVSSKDLKSQSTATHIPSRYLSFINLPSKYELLKLCKQEELVEEQEEYEYSYSFTRYEEIAVDDTFKYAGYKLTGDPLYDIDYIYGAGNSDDKSFDKSSFFDDNLARIKRNLDINLSRMGNYYIIENGRHRLLYLLNYYYSFKKDAKSQADIKYLRKIFTIPANIKCHIEDIDFNQIIKLLGSKYRVYIFKNEIRDDNPDIYISINSLMYHVRTTEELKELYLYIEQKNNRNPYYIGLNVEREEDKERYKRLFNDLTISLKERIFDMRFEDLLKCINSQHLNYNMLYNLYRNMISAVTYSKITGYQNGFIQRAQKEKTRDRLRDYLLKNSNILDNEIKDIYIILQMRFPEYTEDIIHNCLSPFEIEYLKDANSTSFSTKK